MLEKIKAVESAFNKSLELKRVAQDAKFDSEMANFDLVQALVDAGMFHALTVKPGVIRAHLRHLKKARAQGDI